MTEPLVRFALTQRLLVIGLAVALAAGGLWAFRRLPIDAFPDISVPQVQVIAKVPGLSPVEVEARVTRAIELEMRGIPKQAMMRSLTKYALSVVTIDFEEGTDVYWARQQVAERLDQVWPDLPVGVEGGLAPVTTPLGEAFMFTVEGSGHSNMELRTVLDWLVRPRLLSVDGVAEVNSLGGEVRTFEVLPDPDKLTALSLGLDDLARAIARNNRNTGGGRLNQRDEVLLVRTIGRVRTIDDLGRITVTARDGVPIHVDDVAEVRLGSLTRHGGVSKDGLGEHVQGLVLTRQGANSRRTVAAAKEVLEEVAGSLPPGVRIVPFYDRSELVQAAVAMVRNALLAACVLVVLVLLAFMGNLRSAITVAVILPLTVLGTFLLMHLLGLTANLMSLGGLVIAIGILVDPAVVIVENVQGRLARGLGGHDIRHLVYRAVEEVSQPVVSGTAIIVIVFLPILSLTGLEGRMFAPLALTICLALVTAILLALSVIPVVASLLLREGGTDQNFLVRFLQGLHAPLVALALRRRRLFVLAALVLVAGAGLLFRRIGSEFMPTLREGTFVVQTAKLPSISLERSIEIDGELQRAMMELPEVEHVVSRLGSDELRLDPMGLHESDHYLVTRPRSEWEVASEEDLVSALRRRLGAFPGVSFGFTQPIEMRTSEMITGVRAALAVKLFGTDLERLDELSAEVEALVARVPGAVDVMRAPLTGQTYLEVRPDARTMGRFGLNSEDVNELVEIAFGGRVVTEVIEQDRPVGVLLRFPRERRGTPEDLANLLVDTPSGAKINLGSVAAIELVDGPVVLEHEQGSRFVAIQSGVEGRDIVGMVDELRERIGREIDLPAGYFVEFGGEFENQQRAARRLAFVVPLAIALIFAILVSTFRSLSQAGLVILNIPFALIGGIVAVWASGLYLSVPASVGFIALFGTAILNGIVLVTQLNQLRAAGLPLREAVVQGTARRLRPVLMTAVTTGLGLLPLLLASGPGSEIQKPLAIVVVGGLVSSTLLTLVVLPSLYEWLESRTAGRAGPGVPS